MGLRKLRKALLLPLPTNANFERQETEGRHGFSGLEADFSVTPERTLKSSLAVDLSGAHAAA
jgi:hypothetical protein